MTPLRTSLRLLWLTIVDRRTPWMAKVLVTAALVYGASPLDLIPDAIPLLGQADDAAVLLGVLLLFLKMTTSVRAEIRKQNTIDMRPQ